MKVLKNLDFQKKVYFSWTSEIYGKGLAFRKMANYPKFIPLFFLSDHGVNISAVIPKDILETKSKTRKEFYLTWSRENLMKFAGNKNIKLVGIVHPWISYRKKMRINLSENRQGTIFFPLHSAPGWKINIDNRNGDPLSIAFLQQLSIDYYPVSVSIHTHDWDSSMHSEYKKAGFNIISFGNSMNYNYVENFYSIVRNYRYAISESWGSHVAILSEFGIPCKIIHKKILVTDEKNVKVHDDLHSNRLKEVAKIFAKLNDSVTKEQSDLAQKYLGFEFINSRKTTFIIWYSIFLTGLPWLFLNLMNKLRRSKSRITPSRFGNQK